MSRSGYSDDCDGWALIRWRGAVKKAMLGARGQATLREILAALDAMPEKSLVSESLVAEDGGFCTLGALGAAHGLDLAQIDLDDRESVAKAFGIAEAMAAEIMYENDECVSNYYSLAIEICGPMRHWDRRERFVSVADATANGRRWRHMRAWIASQIVAKETA